MRHLHKLQHAQKAEVNVRSRAFSVLTHVLSHISKDRCDKCAFPPCAVCTKIPRPRNSRYHSQKMAEWICGSCAAAPTCSNCHHRLAPGSAAAGSLCSVCQKTYLGSAQATSDSPAPKKEIMQAPVQPAHENVHPEKYHNMPKEGRALPRHFCPLLLCTTVSS